MPRLALPILITSLGELELENAIQLRVFRHQLAPTDRRPQAAFHADVARGLVAIEPISEAMYAEALRLASGWTSRLGTRTQDILHVAAAVVLEAEIFLTFDARQKKLAKAAGLVCR